MSGYVIIDGKAVRADSVAARGAAAGSVSRPPSSGGITSNQKIMFGLAAMLVGPSILMQVYDKVMVEKVDLSDFNIVTHYDTPASEMMDSTLRIQYCASCQVNGQFRRCAVEMQQNFPGMKIEGGPYTPPAYVQLAIRGVRVGQIAVGVFFFFGEQLLAAIGQRPFEFMGDVPTSLAMHGGAVYALNCVAQMLKSINAFEVTYNGEVLHSKLASGRFPDSGELTKRYNQAKSKSKAKPPPQAKSPPRR